VTVTVTHLCVNTFMQDSDGDGVSDASEGAGTDANRNGIPGKKLLRSCDAFKHMAPCSACEPASPRGLDTITVTVTVTVTMTVTVTVNQVFEMCDASTTHTYTHTYTTQTSSTQRSANPFSTEVYRGATPTLRLTSSSSRAPTPWRTVTPCASRPPTRSAAHA
jgi:hypothetical protein